MGRSPTVDDFPHGSELLLEHEGDEWSLLSERDGRRQWCILFHRFKSGGWVRFFRPDGTVDNSRSGMVLVSGDRKVFDSRKVPVKGKRGRKQLEDHWDPLNRGRRK